MNLRSGSSAPVRANTALNNGSIFQTGMCREKINWVCGHKLPAPVAVHFRGHGTAHFWGIKPSPNSLHFSLKVLAYGISCMVLVQKSQRY